MHKFVLRDDVKDTVRVLYAHIRRPPPSDTAQAKNLKRRARTLVNTLVRTPPARPAPLESPELLAVALAFLAGATPEPRTEQDDAELAVALYLAYELVGELRESREQYGAGSGA